MNVIVYSQSYNDKSIENTNFLFDLYAVPNDSASEFTGLDAEVITYFLKNKEMIEFLSYIINILKHIIHTDIDNLMIGFKCITGQQRSVFVAEYIGRFINKTLQEMQKKKYVLSIKHLSGKNWNNKYQNGDKIIDRIIYPV
jgi:RNase adaptor protein for sRNA GlmZ degradation